MNEKAAMSERASMQEKIGYGIGNVGFGALFALVSSYIMYYYTDVAGIGVAAAGLIMTVSRFVDAITDPMMGTIVDRTNTKWGKARPYLLFMAVPLAVVTIIMFTTPSWSQNGKFLYCLIAYVVFCVIYTTVDVPYSSMLSLMTDRQDDRMRFGGFRTMASNIGGFIVTGATLWLVAKIGMGNEQKGFSGAAVVFGLFAIASLFFCFSSTKERIKPINEKVYVKDGLRVAVKNKYWILVICMAFFSHLTAIMQAQSTMYYTKYYLENPGLAAGLLSLPKIVAIPTGILVPVVANKIGAKNCVLASSVLRSLATIGLYLAGDNVAGLYIMRTLNAVGTSGTMCLIYVLCAEAIDYTEWITGERPNGIMTSITGFMIKMGMTMAGLLSSFTLSLGGYVNNAEQSAGALQAITANYIWMPTVFPVIIVILILFYDLDGEKRNKIQEELRQRRQEKAAKKEAEAK